MGFKFNDVGRLIGEGKHEEASKLLVEKLVEHGNNQVRAAKALNVDYRTFTRWLSRLDAAGVNVRRRAQDELAKREAEKAEAEKAAPPQTADDVHEVESPPASPPTTVPVKAGGKRAARARSAAS